MVIYLDTSTLSHMVKARARADRNRWTDLADALQRGVGANVIVCPSAPVVDDEVQLAPSVSRSVRELSRHLGHVRLRHSASVQESQFIRAFHRFIRGQDGGIEHDPPLADASEDDPNDWLPVLSFDSMFSKTDTELIKARQEKVALSHHVTGIFAGYAVERLSFEEIRKREAAGAGTALRRTGRLWPFLIIARRSGLDDRGAWLKVEEFLTSVHAASVPSADITSRLYAAVALASAAPKWGRAPRASDAYDIEQIASYLPYVDVLIADRFFAQLAKERYVGIGPYRGRIQPLGEKNIPEFIEWIESLVSSASHVRLGDLLYDELTRRGDG